jgi:peptide-methionine (S)-S-oxide reductase
MTAVKVFDGSTDIELTHHHFAHQEFRVTRKFAVRLLAIFSLLSAFAGAAVFAQSGATGASKPSTAAAKPVPAKTAKAIFAGGCFWCMEGPFDKLNGVISTTSGYIGGGKKDPTYQEVSAGITGHTEAVEIVYDPAKVTYEKLLDVFWHNIDPLVKDAQFCDRGSQYRSGIFYTDEAQKVAAEASRASVDKTKTFKGTIVTEITAATTFYPAEDYHQDYYIKNPIRYNYYRTGCGRDARLKQLWGDKAGVGSK